MNESYTSERYERRIAQEFYQHFPGTSTVMCLIVLTNGWELLGKATTDSNRFDLEEGKTRARNAAVRQMRELEGYVHATDLARKNQTK